MCLHRTFSAFARCLPPRERPVRQLLVLATRTASCVCILSYSFLVLSRYSLLSSIVYVCATICAAHSVGTRAHGKAPETFNGEINSTDGELLERESTASERSM